MMCHEESHKFEPRPTCYFIFVSVHVFVSSIRSSLHICEYGDKQSEQKSISKLKTSFVCVLFVISQNL